MIPCKQLLEFDLEMVSNFSENANILEYEIKFEKNLKACARPWFCKMTFLLSCDVGIYFDLTEPDVPAFEESYEAASTDIKKNMRFKIWNAPTVVLSSKLLFCDFLCSLTMKIRSFDARFQCRMKHIHTRVRSAIENIDSANETSTVGPPSVELL